MFASDLEDVCEKLLCHAVAVRNPKQVPYVKSTECHLEISFTSTSSGGDVFKSEFNKTTIFSLTRTSPYSNACLLQLRVTRNFTACVQPL